MAAEEELRKVEKALVPATSDQFAGFMYRLQGHYWANTMSEKLAMSVAEDYKRLLGEKYPPDIIQKAYDEWLMEPKNKAYPKPGQLAELMDKHLYIRKNLAMKLRCLITR